MYIEDRDTEIIRLHRRRYTVPRLAGVGRIVQLSLVRDEIGAVRGELVHEDAEEGLTLVQLLPREPFVRRLPNCPVREVEQDGLGLGEVAVLLDDLAEFMLAVSDVGQASTRYINVRRLKTLVRLQAGRLCISSVPYRPSLRPSTYRRYCQGSDGIRMIQDTYRLPCCKFPLAQALAQQPRIPHLA